MIEEVTKDGGIKLETFQREVLDEMRKMVDGQEDSHAHFVKLTESDLSELDNNGAKIFWLARRDPHLLKNEQLLKEYSGRGATDVKPKRVDQMIKGYAINQMMSQEFREELILAMINDLLEDIHFRKIDESHAREVLGFSFAKIYDSAKNEELLLSEFEEFIRPYMTENNPSIIKDDTDMAICAFIAKVRNMMN
ncbi:MAG: hypothetical protein COV07_04290 [Candidatus Vogelbacteria bacterium CG10_big_fil_rev_8_21_14_0_10_45_14]|uniref:Uncharacterized protein n=1 Tax=Candidatus Vogelbacteria bacterium CG10_big_fil_rev_8_21_14_0_10_45_14 TaxID=1975042 RepID=A0A2H0RIE5_9BACT|nr:MAG: hypothetical protein COV07_04290 [Candidatus Vogelbacteria bacterium CG10_big_fil_rev_8_21_14_0_10_45_14]